MNTTTKLAGFHFRPARKGDVIGFEMEVPIYKQDRKGKLVLDTKGNPIVIGTRQKIEYHELSLPVCVRHGFKRHRPRKPKQPAIEPPRKTTAADWRQRGVMMRDTDLMFGRTPHQFQARSRFIRDRAGAYLRQQGIWNPSQADMESAMQHIVNHM